VSGRSPLMVWRPGVFVMGKQGERLTLSVIRDAYFQGEFETCLGLCDAFRPRDAKDAAEVALLRARCLIPLERGAQALEALRGLRLGDDQHDEDLTGRMLMGAAYLSLGQVDRGLEIVLAAYDERANAGPSVQAELTVYLAIAHCRKGEFQRAVAQGLTNKEIAAIRGGSELTRPEPRSGPHRASGRTKSSRLGERRGPA
jgi:hypothetical protein